MVVQHNLTAMNANRYLGINNSKLSKSLEKLSSGYAINRAGDNAAGLAVSEKMRSQIAGMTQGVKNAQDGISMVQTFEGALTETDSILQRMKTLADQMANGSYDDPIDRAAAQQEFLQLNDELDQIADTDFNGVIVLNGGKMADGTLAVDGKFDYKEGVKAPTKLGKSDVNVLDANVWDDGGVADTAWSKLNDQWTREAGKPATYGPDSVDITFQYDKSTSSWKAISATEGANVKNVSTAATQNGGFAVKIGGADAANVVLDQSVLGNGDTITLTFKNPADGISAPTNAGAVVADDTNFTEGNTLSKVAANNLTTAAGSPDPAALTALATAQADATTAKNDYDTKIAATNNAKTAMDTAQKNKDDNTNPALDTTLQGLLDTATADYNTAKTASDAAETTYNDAQTALIQAQADAAKIDPIPVSEMTKDVNELYNQLDGATFEATYTNKASVEGDFKLTLKNGTELKGTAAGASFIIGDTTFKIKTTAADGKVEITNEAGDQVYYTVAASAQVDEAAAGDNATGSIKWKLGIDNNKYDSGAVPSVEVAKTGNVSKSDAFNKSEAILTYKDNITLQVGARTKDAVNFSFEYASTAIGDLKADLNCTAAGLGTDKLTIANQEAANYAIDKIDQAINKVSLVRGTFGAIQNRLEHKIDNMNVSIENLTSAESQIRDTNMPTEMMNFTKQQILAQASQSMLAQANQLPQSVLSLLQ